MAHRDDRSNKRRKTSETEFPSKEKLLSGIKKPSLEVSLSRELTEVENKLEQRPALVDSVSEMLQGRKDALNKALIIIERSYKQDKKIQEQGKQDLQDCLSKKDDFHKEVLTTITQALDNIRLEEVDQLRSDIIKKPSLEVRLSQELRQVGNDLEQPDLGDSIQSLKEEKDVLTRALLIIARVTSEDKEEQEQGKQDLQDCLSKKDNFHQKVLTKITQTLDEIPLEEVAPHPSDAGGLGADPTTRARQSPDVVQRPQASDEGREKPSLRREFADLKKVHEAAKLDPEIRSEQRWKLLASHLRSHFGPSLQIRLAYQKKFHEAEKFQTPK